MTSAQDPEQQRESHGEDHRGPDRRAAAASEAGRSRRTLGHRRRLQLHHQESVIWDRGVRRAAARRTGRAATQAGSSGEVVEDADTDRVAVQAGDSGRRRPPGRPDQDAGVVEVVDLAGDRLPVGIGLVDLDETMFSIRIGSVRPRRTAGDDRGIHGVRERCRRCRGSHRRGRLRAPRRPWRCGGRRPSRTRACPIRIDQEDRQDQRELDQRLTTRALRTGAGRGRSRVTASAPCAAWRRPRAPRSVRPRSA